MRKQFLRFSFILILIAICPFSQIYSNYIDVQLDLCFPSNSLVYLYDIDITNLDKLPVIFRITITGDFTPPIKVVMQIGVKRGDQIIVEGITKPFDIENQPLILTSRDLVQKYSFEETHVNLEELQDFVYKTGRLPVGDYLFFVKVYQTDQVYNDDYDEKLFKVTEPPTVIDLITPGGEMVQDESSVEIYTKLPLFVWHSNGNRFKIIVCDQKEVGENPTNLTDYISTSHVHDEVKDRTFFQYPSQGVRALEYNGVYYWQIFSINESVGPEVVTNGPIWKFKVADLSSGSFPVQIDQILSLLLSFLGVDYENLLEGGELDGCRFTGKMYNDGKLMTQDDLNDLIKKVLNNQITVNGFKVEE